MKLYGSLPILVSVAGAVGSSAHRLDVGGRAMCKVLKQRHKHLILLSPLRLSLCPLRPFVCRRLRRPCFPCGDGGVSKQLKVLVATKIGAWLSELHSGLDDSG